MASAACIGRHSSFLGSPLSRENRQHVRSSPSSDTPLPFFRPHASQSQCRKTWSSGHGMTCSRYLSQSENISVLRLRRLRLSSQKAKGTKCAAAQGNAGGPDGLPAALLFDCDGVLVDTERDGHRIAFNETFKEKGLQEDWDVQTYGKLLEIGGGKERMTHHFNEVGWPSQIPSDEQGRKDFIAGMHKRKTEIFMKMVESGAMPLRPGVARLVDEAFAAGVPVAVCSTSNEKAVSAIVRVMLGAERAAKIRIFAGDVVPKKKPDPAIYNLAAKELNVDPSRCVVIEDSFIGLSAAKAAGMTCVVTKSVYTQAEDFARADAVFESIGDTPTENFGLRDLSKLCSRALA